MRVGIQESIPPDLLKDFPAEAEIVHLPLVPSAPTAIDFWVMPFSRGAAEAQFAQLRGVKAAQSLMAGVDWILPWLPKEITLCDGRGVHDVPTAELALALMLASLKWIPQYRDAQMRQQWTGQFAIGGSFHANNAEQPAAYLVLGDELHGKTVLIVGYGSIGAAIEARLAPFGVTVMRIARNPRENPVVHTMADLPQLLPQADIVVIQLPLTTESRGSIGNDFFAQMKPGALFINMARGPIVLTGALVDALQSGHIHAALDVTDPEPLPAGHPLWSAPNCLIVPHVGGSTAAFLGRGLALAARQVQHLLRNEPLENIVSNGY